MSAVADNPYLMLPLAGVRAIEASAGTGKTFTLATLVLRLVVEDGLRIEQILAVTFTEAATQELRARIRARLLLASALLEATPGASGPEAGVVVDESPDAAISRRVLEGHRARSGESLASLRQRLRMAIDGIDLAAIHTIHGFCTRVLREHALESGQDFDTPELLANDRALREEVAADLWRVRAVDPDAADDLLALWPGGPETLAADLSVLVRERVLLPERQPLPPNPSSQLRAAAETLISSVRDHGEAFHEAILAAIEGKVIHGGSYKAAWVGELFAALQEWAADADPAQPFDHAKLAMLTRKLLVAKTNKGKDSARPDSPLADAVGEYIDVKARIQAYHEARRVILLHKLRDEARQRLALRKRQLRVQTYDDLIDRVADALDGPQADALVAALRRQYRVALVDEFQDTDARQWRIFNRVFGSDGGNPALFLIGDPKQAIYGFRGGDVHTYLRAKGRASEAPALDHNFRSRPSLLTAVQALYDAAEAAGVAAFVTEDIRFHAVQPGGVCLDEYYLVAGGSTAKPASKPASRSASTGIPALAPAPALTLWQAPSPPPDDNGTVKPWSAGEARDLATAACVAAIHRALSQARSGGQLIDGRPLQAGDIAVLVRSHSDATRIRQALAQVGIAAVAAGRQSLFATEEARDLHALLLALLHSADDGRLRMALATVLIGVDAAGMAALERDGQQLHDWRVQALAWRERLDDGGALALINDLCAQQAQRLLGLLDGERRLSNYLQLAEALQEAQRDALGLHGLVDWLARAIAHADGNDDTQLLRLESDARRVQIVTLHKSKGLEYPLVFLPYAGIGGKARSPGNRVLVNDDHHGRRLHWKIDAEDAEWKAALDQWKRDQQAEDARLLYVGLTRARHALWLAIGDFYNHKTTALAPMVANAPALAAAHAPAIVIDDRQPPEEPSWLPPENDVAVPPARSPQRPVPADWWVYSFTQLAHADGQSGRADDGAPMVMTASTEDGGGATDEPAFDALLAEGGDDDAEGDSRFAGSRFGNVLHTVLERADFAAWADWCDGDGAPDDQRALLHEALLGEGYSETDLDDGAALLATLVGRTLTVELPEGGALHVLPDAARRSEIEFHFAMAPTAVSALIALLHDHGVVRERRGFGLRRRLEGLMTGKIDLTYVRDGRWYLLDYKTNRLPRYDQGTLATAMANSEYDLQALIYTLALHRWLRFRLGEHYDYTRDFGGIRYLFCRGLAPGSGRDDGIHAQRFAPELVHALDALFAGQAKAYAA